MCVYVVFMQRCGVVRGDGKDRLMDEKDAMYFCGLGEVSGTVG